MNVKLKNIECNTTLPSCSGRNDEQSNFQLQPVSPPKGNIRKKEYQAVTNT